MPKDTLLARIRDRSATVAVLGLGYVGLPLAVGFAQAGFRTLGLDVDADKVERLNAGESYIADVPAGTVAALVRGGRLSASSDFARLQDCDAVSICVPTPLSKTHDPDLSYVVAAAESIAAHVHAGMLIVLESTTYPGTTEEIVVPRLLHNGLRVGADVFVAFSPERIDPGRSDYTLANTPKVMGGVTPDCLEVATALYGAVVERVVPVSSTQAAEMVKLLENTFRAVNIALVNEVLLMCDRLGLDAWEIIEAAATKPYGFMKFTPGPGVGGHCLDGNETVRYRWGRANGVMRLADLYALAFERSRRTFEHLGGSFVAPRGLEVLSIDPATGAQSWQPVTFLFARDYAGTLVDVETTDRRRLTVTDRHPMLVHADGALAVREALALQPGDLLPLVQKPEGAGGLVLRQIPVIDWLPPDLATGVRVRHRSGWAHAQPALRAVLGDRARDVVRDNSLPLLAWRALHRELQGGLEDLTLLTGRGPSHSSFPAVVSLNAEFARLVGYFLSEGCISRGQTGRPVLRFTFNRDETEYLADIRRLLAGLGLRVSEHNSRKWHTTTLKVSGWLLPWMLRNVLHTGTDAYSMRVPDCLMAAPPTVREELLKGLFRGDGDVHVRSGLRQYRKNGRVYHHQDNAGQVGFFTSSQELLEQVTTLLQELGLTPSRRSARPHLRFHAGNDLERLEGWFLGEKARRLADLRANKVRRAATRRPKVSNQYAVASVKQVSPRQSITHVYSVEVGGYHTFATSAGIYVHNCIPLDPHYLSWKLRTLNYNARFIQLASELNTAMPAYWVTRVAEALNEDGLAVKGANVLVLGVTYKRDVGDIRESPAIDIIELLEARGARVSFHDPFVPSLAGEGLATPAVELTPEAVAGADCVVIVTDHSSYDWAWLQANARRVVDTRNALRRLATLGARV